jgi:hypothetical protein
MMKNRAHIELCAQLAIWVVSLKISQRMGSGWIFSENFIALPFKEDMSTDTTFNQIHLAGHYL